MTKKKYLKYIPFTIAAIFFVYIQVQCDLKLPSFLTRIVDEGIVQQDMSLILKIGIDMLGYVLIGTVATIIVSYLAAIVSTRISRDLRGDVFKKIESYSMHEFDEFSTASLITRNTNDIQQVQMCIFMILRMFTMAPIMAVGGIVKAIETSKEISWILAVSIPLTLFVILALMFFIVPVFGKIQGYVDNLNKVSRESLTGIRVIRAFRNEKLEEERFDSVNSALTKTNIFMGRMMSLLHPAALLIMNLTQLAIIWFGAKAANLGNLQTGEIAAFINYAMQAIMSFMMLTMAAFVVPRAFVSWKRISAVLKTDSSIISAENAITLSDGPSDSVEFKNVSFSYPGANENVLSDISFIAKKGQTTAFIGSTGCGKSTLVNLIPRFYDITSGEILLGGIDIRNLELKNLREKIGYVPQKSVLFSGTIESNITQGRQNATQQELELAAKIAQAEDFILEKNDGYKSEVSQGGTNVSGGQKQRLSIARAIIKKPDVYIFDDSFSALDFKTDKMLRKALEPYTREAITLIVAQRISTIMTAEQIIVLDEGKIVGIGSHRELLSGCSVYKEIAHSQLSKEELE